MSIVAKRVYLPLDKFLAYNERRGLVQTLSYTVCTIHALGE